MLAAAPASARTIDVNVHADHTVSGTPAIDTARATATTRFTLDAPAGAEVRVQVPDGVGMNGWAWANEGRTGISFAQQGAEWVTTAKEPLHQLSLQTSAFQGRTSELRVADGKIEVGDLAPRVSVDGVAQDAARPAVSVSAPIGWKTVAANGAADALRTVKGVDGIVVGDRDAALGAATVATFDGRAPDGSSTTGVKRVAREAAQKAGDAAVSAAYTALALLGGVG